MNRKIDELSLREWKTASASQIKSFRTCQAKWWFEKVAGIRGEASAAMERGTLVHAILEHSAVHDALPTMEHIIGLFDEYPLFLDEYLPKYGNDKRRLADWLLQIASYASLFMPQEPVSPMYVERGFTMHSEDLPVPVIGYIDLMEPDNVGITDYKVRSTGRYAMTPAELREDPQSALYAAVLDAIHSADPSATKNTDRGFMTTIDAPSFADGYFRHLNLCIKENEGRESRLNYTAEEAKKMYAEHIVAPILEMHKVSQITDPRELTANPQACKKYGRTCINYNMCYQAGHVEPREIDLIMGFDIGKFMSKRRESVGVTAEEEKPRLTGINPPGGVSREDNPSPNEYDSKYKGRGPYFPDGSRMQDFRKVELRGKLAEVYESLTDAEKALYQTIEPKVGTGFEDNEFLVNDLRAAAAAMIRAYAGNDEDRCRKCAVDPIGELPTTKEPEPPTTEEPEPVAVAPEPVTATAPGVGARLALVGCYVTQQTMVDFHQWSEPLRTEICKNLKVANLGDAEYAEGYKAFVRALESATKESPNELPTTLYVDPMDPLYNRLLPWLSDNYLIVRR